MVLLKNFKNIFLIPELRKKILFTLGVLIIDRLGTYIPVIGVNVPMLGEHMKRATGVGGLLSYLDVFSGGALSKSTLFALGIMPYITASIMMQILGMSVPYFEQLLKEGEYGKKIINQYTRYLAIGLSIMYSYGYAVYLENANLVLTPGWAFRALFVLSLTVGSLFVMWLGDQISLYGIGNGSSMIVFAGIVSRFPEYIIKTKAMVDIGTLEMWQALFILVIFIAITACIVFLEKGERKVPVQYARRIIGQKMYGGQSTFIPFKINTAGIMPVILASSVLQLPATLAVMLSSRGEFFRKFAEIIAPGAVLFNVIEFFLIVFFSFFYTALVFNPDELAENIKKSGGYILGIRPGKKTAEFFDYILNRIGLVGALYLACLALLPNFMYALFKMPFYLGGTSLLIVVGVALETSAQIESYLIEHRYEGFLTTGRMKSRIAR
ncbi:MAG: preprotein translocase subunit SecY [Candidatus Dependentiae bacterium ADurb.Bin331]|nr:MAG: preprotein translocase subunit SecY [Candidatus Dependentiae bacterium ADurb.Bin331]